MLIDLSRFLGTYFHEVFIVNFDAWVILGFVAQAFFTMRFVVQWLATEKARESVVPVSFWLLLYRRRSPAFGLRALSRDPVFIAGQAFGLFVYARNLYFVIAKGKAARKSATETQLPEFVGRSRPA